MRIVIAPDKFKGSMTAGVACEAIARGLRRLQSDLEVISIPMADGGEGTVEALVSATGGRFRPVRVSGPLGDEIEAVYGILDDSEWGMVGVIEMAAAAGLALLPKEHRNPLKTTTYGVGQMILDGLDQGCGRFIIGIGGSATNDSGTGLAQALGVRFFRANGDEIDRPMCGGYLGEVRSIDLEGMDARIRQGTFTVACDVDNPLLGANGASYVYSPQKGADGPTVRILESNMEHIVGLIEEVVGREVRDIPGSGAAGGLGAGLMAFVNARLEGGIDLVMQACRFSERIANADLIVTGEGRIDGTTVSGKTIAGIAGAAAKSSIPVVALTGCLGEGYEKVLALPSVCALFSICSGPMALEEAMRNGEELLEGAAEQVMRLIQVGFGGKKG